MANWPTPKTPTGGGQVQRNTPGGGIRKLEDAVSGEIGYNTGQLNSNWVEILMGYAIGYTDIDCDEPTEWPGWPAGLGWATPDCSDRRSAKSKQQGLSNQVKPWSTPRAGNPGSQPNGKGGEILAEQAKLTASGQYPYEPPRVITGQKNRAKRLKCLGNSVVSQQAYPIFKAIMEVSQCKDSKQ